MKVIDTAISDLKILEPRVFDDNRGFFMEAWNADTFRKIGLDLNFVQDNHSQSDKGVLRGLHYQLKRPQGKLMRVVAGRAYDVAVDMRRSSPSFGRWVGVELSAQNKRLFWVPPGFAHGFLSLEDGTNFLYKCTDSYIPEYERSLLWNDAALGIMWPRDGIETLHMSDKDRAGLPLTLAEAYP